MSPFRRGRPATRVTATGLKVEVTLAGAARPAEDLRGRHCFSNREQMIAGSRPMIGGTDGAIAELEGFPHLDVDAESPDT
jgi:hypothetical protein